MMKDSRVAFSTVLFCIKYTSSLVAFDKKKFNHFAVKCGKCSY